MKKNNIVEPRIDWAFLKQTAAADPPSTDADCNDVEDMIEWVAASNHAEDTVNLAPPQLRISAKAKERNLKRKKEMLGLPSKKVHHKLHSKPKKRKIQISSDPGDPWKMNKQDLVNHLRAANIHVCKKDVFKDLVKLYFTHILCQPFQEKMNCQ